MGKKKNKKDAAQGLDLTFEAEDVQAKDVIMIGSRVEGRPTGKSRAKVRTIMGDDSALVIGAIINGSAPKKS
jgi:hypothetical protein